MRPWKISLIVLLRRRRSSFHDAFTHQEGSRATACQRGQYAVAKLPDPEESQAYDYFVMDLTDPKAEEYRHYSGDDKLVTRWLLFRLFRKCSGYHIHGAGWQIVRRVRPGANSGYGGTKDFAAFFKWALAETNLESEVTSGLDWSST